MPGNRMKTVRISIMQPLTSSPSASIGDPSQRRFPTQLSGITVFFTQFVRFTWNSKPHFRRALILIFALICLPLVPSVASAVELQWQDEQGTIHSLDEYKGKPVLVHFWASWCGPCRGEMPKLTAWLKQHPQVTIIPISLDDSIADAKAFLTEHQFALPAQIGDQNQAFALGARGLPTTMTISASGDITARQIGALPWDDPQLSKAVLQALTPTQTAP